jgi:uncharacterized protein
MTNQTVHSIMPRHRLSCLLFLIALSACSSNQTQDDTIAAPQTNPSRPAQSKPAPQADNAFKSYALQDANNGDHLQKAAQYVQQGDTANALKELDLINQGSLSTEQRSQFHLQEAQIALSSGDAEQALNKLEQVRPRLLEGDDKIHFYQSLAFAESLVGDALASASARIRLGSLLKEPAQQKDNVAAIVDALSVLPVDRVQQAPANVREEIDGWVALAKILQQRGQPNTDTSSQLQAWRIAYPAHPANADFLQNYLAGGVPTSTGTASADAATQPASAPSGPMIAVLLPTSGNYAAAAQAIKQGLKAAAKIAPNNLPLKFYDTEQGDIAALYQQAVNEGAKQVIGPLVKEQIQSLSYGHELSVPVLALNQVDGLNKANLYQFGLNPADEAQQLAVKAHKDGRQNAVILVPNSSQGHRIEQLLTSAWYAQGGMVLGSQSYDPKQHDAGNLLNALLQPVDASGKKPPQTVFISAAPEVARELAPALRFHQNDNLAVYAMPNVYSGRPDPVRDADLGKIQFCDMPWLLNRNDSGPLSQNSLQAAWQNLGDSQIKLFAMGLDAYNLIGHLDQLSATPYNGASGRLSLNSDNHIDRHLMCAEFRAGAPVASGFAD